MKRPSSIHSLLLVYFPRDLGSLLGRSRKRSLCGRGNTETIQAVFLWVPRPEEYERQISSPFLIHATLNYSAQTSPFSRRPKEHFGIKIRYFLRYCTFFTKHTFALSYKKKPSIRLSGFGFSQSFKEICLFPKRWNPLIIYPILWWTSGKQTHMENISSFTVISRYFVHFSFQNTKAEVLACLTTGARNTGGLAWMGCSKECRRTCTSRELAKEVQGILEDLPEEKEAMAKGRAWFLSFCFVFVWFLGSLKG